MAATATKPEVNRSQVIRDFVTKNPAMPITEVVTRRQRRRQGVEESGLHGQDQDEGEEGQGEEGEGSRQGQPGSGSQQQRVGKSPQQILDGSFVSQGKPQDGGKGRGFCHG